MPRPFAILQIEIELIFRVQINSRPNPFNSLFCHFVNARNFENILHFYHIARCNYSAQNDSYTLKAKIIIYNWLLGRNICTGWLSRWCKVGVRSVLGTFMNLMQFSEWNFTWTRDSGRPIFMATSSRIKISGYFVLWKSDSRISSWALVKVVLSRLCFRGGPEVV